MAWSPARLKVLAIRPNPTFLISSHQTVLRPSLVTKQTSSEDYFSSLHLHTPVSGSLSSCSLHTSTSSTKTRKQSKTRATRRTPSCRIETEKASTNIFFSPPHQSRLFSPQSLSSSRSLGMQELQRELCWLRQSFWVAYFF